MTAFLLVDDDPPVVEVVAGIGGAINRLPKRSRRTRIVRWATGANELPPSTRHPAPTTLRTAAQV